MPMTKNLEVREVLNQIINDPEYREYSRIPLLSLHQLGMIVLCWSAAFFSIYGYVMGWFGVPVSWVLMITAIFLSFTPLHDGAHKSLSSNAFLNDFLGTVSVNLLLPGANMPTWRALHMEHHRFVGDEKYDPDDTLVNVPKKFGILYLMFTDVHWVHWYFTEAKDRWPKRMQFWVLLTVAALVVSHVAFLLSPYWWEFLFLYVVPQRIALWLVVYCFAYIQHPHGLTWEEQPFQSTVRVKSNPIVSALLQGQAAHCVHHLLPHLPWYRYGKVWEFANGILQRQNIPERAFLTPAQEIILPEPPGSDVRDVLITEAKDVGKDVRSYTFEPMNGDQLPEFSAGSHINLFLSSGRARQYSLLNSASEKDRYQIAVKRDEYGRGGSKEVHEAFQEGGIAQISKPHNNFVLYETAPRYVLIAGGIGITPMLSMAHRLARLEKPFVLHICVRSADDLPFAEELKKWSFAPNVEVHYDYVEGSSTIDIDRVLKLGGDGTLLYICGPSGFMDWVSQTAIKSGWPENEIITESFGAAPFSNKEDKDFRVILNRSGRQLDVKFDESLIDALRKENIKVAYACMQGTCGACLTSIVKGEADHRDALMTDHEKSQNKQMCLCVSRAKGGEIILDL